MTSRSLTGKANAPIKSTPTRRATGRPSRPSSSVLTFQFVRIGKVKALARSTHAYCDYDSRTAPRLRPFYALCRIVGLRLRWIRYDRTHHGWHVVCRFTVALTPSELVA